MGFIMKIRILPIVGMLVLILGCWIVSAKAQSSQAALDACFDKELGDVCSFENVAGDSINGSCGYTNGVNSKLICIPIH